MIPSKNVHGCCSCTHITNCELSPPEKSSSVLKDERQKCSRFKVPKKNKKFTLEKTIFFYVLWFSTKKWQIFSKNELKLLQFLTLFFSKLPQKKCHRLNDLFCSCDTYVNMCLTSYLNRTNFFSKQNKKRWFSENSLPWTWPALTRKKVQLFGPFISYSSFILSEKYF